MLLSMEGAVFNSTVSYGSARLKPAAQQHALLHLKRAKTLTPIQRAQESSVFQCALSFNNAPQLLFCDGVALQPRLRMLLHNSLKYGIVAKLVYCAGSYIHCQLTPQ